MDTPEIIVDLSALLALVMILLAVLHARNRERRRKAASEEKVEQKFHRLARSSLDLPSQAVEEGQDQTSERCWPLQDKKEEFEGEHQETQRGPVPVGQIDRLSIEEAELTPEQVSSSGQHVDEGPKACDVINDKEKPSDFAEGAIAIADDESSGESITVEPVPPETIFEGVSAIPDEPPKIARTTRIAPEKRGGRPRGREEKAKKHELDAGTLWCPRPEVICWKRERQWIVGVEAPEELLEKAGLEVFQDESPLTQDESRQGCWRLRRCCGEVVVLWNEDGVAKEVSIALDDLNYFLFKVSGQGQNQGRRVKSASSGSYLAIVPDNWERDEALSGPPPVAPEPVSLAGYTAHFFDLEIDGDMKIAFHMPTGESFVVEPGASRFELVGTRLNDASEHVGPLFGNNPPKIRALDDQAWRDVGKIVVGEEGRGRKRWRTWFRPDPGLIGQDLPSEVAARKGGWYFLRFYDRNDDLLESLDFRFLACLTDISIHQPPPLPAEGGHEPVCVEFLHGPRCKVCLSKKSLANALEIEPQGDRSAVTIPPDPACDLTYWEIASSRAPKVKVEVLIERVWWSLGTTRWKDKPLAVTNQSFSATSDDTIYLWLPEPGWIDSVMVGFERDRARMFRPGAQERKILIPLREFGDSTEVHDGTKQPVLKVWVHAGDIGEREAAICRIVRQPEPTPAPPEEPRRGKPDPMQRASCSTCDHARTQKGSCWCRRYHWPRVTDYIFKQEYAASMCGEWQGEYYDPSGK